MKSITLAIMAIAGLAGATTAFAGENGWYVFGAAGQTTGNNDQSTLDNALTSVGAAGFSSSLSKPTVYNLDVGYQVNKNFAIEGGYIGSTNETYTASGGNLVGPVSATANIKGWTLAAVGILPLPNQFSLLGKLGVAGIKDSATVSGPGGSASVDGTKTDATYGLGAEYDFTNAVLVRLDWDSYNVGDSSSSSRGGVWTVGIGYKF
ncbi:MAG: porin family protein [Gallionella sp.]